MVRTPAPVALGFVMLVAAACGDGGAPAATSPVATASGPAGTGTSGSPAAPSPSSPGTDVPDVVLRDVGTGADVRLRALGLSDRPTLYWFWAPH